MVGLVFLAFICTCFAVDFLIRYKRRKEAAIKTAASNALPLFDESLLVVPGGLYFDKSHTWAHMEPNGKVKIGINDFLQHVTGSITRVIMKKSGEEIKKGELLFKLIQKGKQLNIYAPLSGVIKAQNVELVKNTSLLNSSPYGDGWIYLIEPENWINETKLMMMAEKAIEWMKNEFVRLKDFFAKTIQTRSSEFAFATLQDGGQLQDRILENMGPEIWEDFQTNFIDAN